MDRRAFLQRGVVGASGVAAVGQPALVSAAQRGGSPLYSMDDYLARMDAGLQRVSEWSIRRMVPNFSGDVGVADDLGRKAFTSIYMTGMFADLPIEEQVRPEVQDRMWAVQPTMDAALEDMTAYLRSRTEEELGAVQRVLRDDPTAIERIAEVVDLEAARTGISDERRRQTRRLIDHAGWRLANQPPALLINEYLDKVERISASDIDEEARRRWLASKVGERAFWAAAQQEQSRRDRRISRGTRNLGIGSLVFLGGLLLVFVGDQAGSDGVIGVGAVVGTVGVIWFLVGLIQLIAGGATSSEA